MSPDHFLWLSTGSTDRPMILTPRLSNSGLSRAMVPSSVVHTGVKSFGWENSTAQELPIQSWKRILPSVVCASKSGATSLIARVITHLPRKLVPNTLASIVVGRSDDSLTQIKKQVGALVTASPLPEPKLLPPV